MQALNHPRAGARLTLCTQCRQHHQGCPGQRPQCHRCEDNNRECVYEAGTFVPEQEFQRLLNNIAHLQGQTRHQQQQLHNQQDQLHHLHQQLHNQQEQLHHLHQQQLILQLQLNMLMERTEILEGQVFRLLQLLPPLPQVAQNVFPGQDEEEVVALLLLVDLQNDQGHHE